MKILVALYMKFICPAVAQPPYSTWDKVIVLGASTTYALKLKSSSKYVFPSRCTQCDKRFSRGSNAKYHIQQVHEKNMERKIDQEFFDRNKGLFEDYALTDPNYPTSEIVRAKIEEARKKFKYQQPGSPSQQQQAAAVTAQQTVPQPPPPQPQALHHMPAPVLMTN